MLQLIYDLPYLRRLDLRRNCIKAEAVTRTLGTKGEVNHLAIQALTSLKCRGSLAGSPEEKTPLW